MPQATYVTSKSVTTLYGALSGHSPHAGRLAWNRTMTCAQTNDMQHMSQCSPMLKGAPMLLAVATPSPLTLPPSAFLSRLDWLSVTSLQFQNCTFSCTEHECCWLQVHCAPAVHPHSSMPMAPPSHKHHRGIMFRYTCMGCTQLPYHQATSSLVPTRHHTVYVESHHDDDSFLSRWVSPIITGCVQGCGLVEFADAASAVEAIATLHGTNQFEEAFSPLRVEALDIEKYRSVLGEAQEHGMLTLQPLRQCLYHTLCYHAMPHLPE
jgi:hypothetical protein